MDDIVLLTNSEQKLKRRKKFKRYEDRKERADFEHI